MPKPPTGSVTFLFTDIEGSTKLWEQFPKAMQPALASHDAILRAAVQAHGGHIVKMTGDGIHAAFAQATSALTAALEIQRNLCGHAWGETGTLRVRIGLHTGVVEARDGDYYGSPVNRAARLMSVGHGGQILLSHATQELVRDTLPAEIVLHDLGLHRLKDLIQPERIFQIHAPDLPADFPQLRTLDARSNNLPLQLTPLIGREAQVTTAQNILRSQVRLLTLTGVGGTGKTRLGLQVAADLLDDFPDGVFLVNLAPIHDASLIASTIAQALGVRESGAESIVENLKTFLRDKQLLLVLDNFEQIIIAALFVADLLANCPRIKILVTSREALRVRGESELPIPPLDVPDLKRALSAFQISPCAAIELFVQRATSIKHDFALTDNNARVIAEICVRLDGLPLAIELAAARSRVLSPQMILERLSSRLALLTIGARDLPSRHQTLRSAIAWSYDLLEEREQTLFRRLGVFVGGCSLPAAEAICRASENNSCDLLDGLASLVDKNLVRQINDEEPRFTMLETIREFALEKLEASGEIKLVRDQHAKLFLQLAEQAEPKLRGAEQKKWFACLEQEHDNLRTGLGWYLDDSQFESAARLAGALWHFWYVRGHLSEGCHWLERSLRAGKLSASVRAKLLNGLGVIARVQGDVTQSQKYLEECLAARREMDDRPGIAGTLNSLGIVFQHQGKYAQAQALFEECLVLRRASGDRAGIAVTLGNLGVAMQNQGNYERAAALYEESLSIKREFGDKVGIAYSTANIGVVALRQSDYAKASNCFTESLTLAREIGDKQHIASCLNYVGFITLFQLNIEQARTIFTECLTLFQEMGHKEGIAEGLEGLGAVAGALHQAGRAVRLFGAADALRESAHSPHMPDDRVIYEHHYDAARAQLDSNTFAEEWARGRALTLAQAIVYALEASQ